VREHRTGPRHPLSEGVSTVNQTLPSHAERMDAARERLRAALDPQTGPEKSIVDWFGKHDEPTLTILSEMVERAIARATASAYERGWLEAGGRK